MLCYALRLSYGFCTVSRGCFLFVAEPVKRDFRFCKLTRSLHHAACGLYTGKGGEVGGPRGGVGGRLTRPKVTEALENPRKYEQQEEG